MRTRNDLTTRCKCALRFFERVRAAPVAKVS